MNIILTIGSEGMTHRVDVSSFMYDEDEEFKNILQKFSEFIRIRRNDNSIIIPHEGVLGNYERIALYLVGTYVRHLMNLQKNPSAKNSEIASYLKLKPNIVNARLKELREDKVVEPVARGEHKVFVLGLNTLPERLQQKTKRDE